MGRITEQRKTVSQTPTSTASQHMGRIRRSQQTATPVPVTQPQRQPDYQQDGKDVFVIKPNDPVAPKKPLSTYAKIGEGFGQFSQKAITDFGYQTGRILDQIFHAGSRYAKEREKNIDSTLSTVGNVADKLGLDTSVISKVKNIPLADKLEQKRLQFKQNLELGRQESDIANPFAQTFAGKVTGAVSGMIPQVALAYTGAPAIALSLSESFMNVEDSYDENIKNGMSVADATKRAVPQLGADLLGTYLSNKLGAMSKLTGGKSLINIPNKTIGNVLEYLKDSGLEVAQEVYQTGLQNLATNKPLTEGMSETALVTIIPAMLFGAVGQMSQSDVSEKLIEINTKVQNNEPLTEEEAAVYTITGGKDPFATAVPTIKPEELSQIASQIKIQSEGQSIADFQKFQDEVQTATFDKLVAETVPVDNGFQATIQAGDKTITLDTVYPTEDAAIKASQDIIDTYNTEDDLSGVAFKKKDDNRLSTTILEDLKGRETVSKQYILDATNRGDLKQQERDIIRHALETEGDKVNVADFTKKVQAELLPLKVRNSVKLKTKAKSDLKKLGYTFERDMSGDALLVDKDGEYPDYDELPENVQKLVDIALGNAETYEEIGGSRYENISLPDELRGNVKNYKEKIYESPIKTSAGSVHFGSDTENYFGHTRIEDMVDGTRRVIEVQSDLFQKGNLDKEGDIARTDGLTSDEVYEYDEILNAASDKTITQEQRERAKILGTKMDKYVSDKEKGFVKLQQYANPTAHFRMVREEVKTAAEDGVETLQFPTGETAMKIEGLGSNNQWRIQAPDNYITSMMTLTPDMLEVGLEVTDGNFDRWIVTDILGDGKFKAVPEDSGDYQMRGDKLMKAAYDEDGNEFDDDVNESDKETFDMSGKIDTNNPIYRFYEKDLGKYLKNKYGAKLVTDDKGVTWYEVDIKPEYADQPVVAFKQKQETQKLIDRKIAIKQLSEYLTRLGIDADVRFVDGIITPDLESAYGAFFDNTITFDQFITDTTVVHEIGHAIFRNLERLPMFKGITRNQLYAEARTLYADKITDKTTNLDLEEMIMEDLEVFAKQVRANKPTTFTGKIKQFLSGIYKQLTSIFEPQNRSAIQDFYNRIETGKAQKVTRLAPLGTIEAYMRGDILDFGDYTAPAFMTKKDIPFKTIKDEYEQMFSEPSDSIEEYNLIQTITEKYGDIPTTMAELNQLSEQEVEDILPYLPRNLQYKLAGISIDEFTETGETSLVNKDIDDLLGGKIKIRLSELRADAKEILGTGVLLRISTKNKLAKGLDEFADDHNMSSSDFLERIAERYEQRKLIREQVKKDMKAEREAMKKIADSKKKQEQLRKALEKSVNKAIKNIPTQKTTEGIKTKKVIESKVISKKDMVTLKKSEQSFIKDKLKQQETGIILGQKQGIKIGKQEQLNKYLGILDEVKRKAELEKLNTAITRRSYINQALDTIRKNIPPTERFEYMTALANIGKTGSYAQYNALIERVLERKAQIDIEKGERKELARKRSTLAYLKMLNDVNPKLIKDVKETLSLDKPVNKMNRVELDKLLDEVKNRITFIQVNNLVKTPEAKEMTTDDYIKIGKAKPTKKYTGMRLVLDTIAKKMKEVFLTLGSRLKSISPEMFYSMESMIFEQNKYLQDVAKPVVDSFDKMIQSLSPELQVSVKGALMSQRFDIARNIIESEGIDSKPLDDVTELMNDIYGKLKSVGVDVSYLNNFFPRYLTEGARAEILDIQNRNLSQAIDEKRAEVGRDLTQEEKAKVYGNYFRGFEFGSKIMLSDGRFGESRDITTLTNREVVDRYEDLTVSLVNYVSQANVLYQSRKFFNKYDPKFIETIKDGDFESGVDAFVESLAAREAYTGSQLKEVQEVLKTYFGAVEQNVLFKLATQYAYIRGLGSPLSFIPQFFEAGVNTAINLEKQGINPIERFDIKPEDIYINIDFDVQDTKLGKFAEMTTIPMRTGDQIGALVAVNQIYNVIKSQAQKNVPELREKVEYIYGKDRVDEVMKTLANAPTKVEGEVGEEMKRMIFSEISERRVLSRLDKSQTLIQNPSWGVFRSYTIKMINNIIFQGNADIKKGIATNDKSLVVKGIRRKSVLIAALMVAGASSQLIKDLIRGNKMGSLPDYILNSFFQLFGLSRYGLSNYKKQGLLNTIWQLVAPAPVSIPASDIERIIRDIQKGTWKSLQQIPIAGEVLNIIDR